MLICLSREDFIYYVLGSELWDDDSALCLKEDMWELDYYSDMFIAMSWPPA